MLQPRRSQQADEQQQQQRQQQRRQRRRRHATERGGAGASALVLAVAAAAVLRGARALNPAASGDAFIGWEGESYRPHGGADAAAAAAAAQADGGGAGDRQRWIEVASWKPRAFIHHGFLSDAECEHVKRLAAPTMKRSTVVGRNGSSVRDAYRTSYGTFVRRKADAIIDAIEQRVALWARVAPENAEDMQVLRYGVGQEYRPHMDTLADDEAGPRVATVLLYLNDVPAGGETAFPDSNHWVDPKEQPRRLGPFSPCAAGAVAVRPRKGDALLFWSIKPDGRHEDSFSMHTGCPVLAGVKWTATKWIHARPFRPALYGQPDRYEAIDPGVCRDHDALCDAWAANGECKNNPAFMLGDMGNPGRCAKACGGCTACAPGDRACYNGNRRRAGFLVYAEGDGGLDEDAPGENVL